MGILGNMSNRQRCKGRHAACASWLSSGGLGGRHRPFARQTTERTSGVPGGCGGVRGRFTGHESHKQTQVGLNEPPRFPSLFPKVSQRVSPKVSRSNPPQRVSRKKPRKSLTYKALESGAEEGRTPDLCIANETSKDPPKSKEVL